MTPVEQLAKSMGLDMSDEEIRQEADNSSGDMSMMSAHDFNDDGRCFMFQRISGEQCRQEAKLELVQGNRIPFQ